MIKLSYYIYFHVLNIHNENSASQKSVLHGLMSMKTEAPFWPIRKTNAALTLIGFILSHQQRPREAGREAELLRSAAMTAARFGSAHVAFIARFFSSICDASIIFFSVATSALRSSFLRLPGAAPSCMRSVLRLPEATPSCMRPKRIPRRIHVCGSHDIQRIVDKQTT